MSSPHPRRHRGARLHGEDAGADRDAGAGGAERGPAQGADPLEFIPGAKDRHLYSHLEALGRLLAGIAPWLELGPDDSEEGKARKQLIGLTSTAIAQAVDPQSPDFMNFSQGAQPLVDLGVFSRMRCLRAPVQIWGNLDQRTRQRVVACLKKTRRVQPARCNCFSLAQ